MPIRITLVAGCIAALLPLSVTAARPVSSDCAILLEVDSVTADIPFSVFVKRVPGYPGQWFAPTISVDLEVPVNPGITGCPNSYSQNVTLSVDGLGGSNSAEVTFYIPSVGTCIDPGQMRLTATVSEPLSKNKDVVVASCEAFTTLN